MSRKIGTQQPCAAKRQDRGRGRAPRTLGKGVRLEAILSGDKLTQWSLSNLF